ncbi:MAG: SDR family NAD(P)-dependent oxidoreductase, partial [Rhodospirillales bacterium]|nr:SDR family NAD(P)-dependent oxidoreductase [Acetobacter sp.]
MSRLEGKRALITGGSSGIGLQTVRLFLREGARVVLSGQDESNLAAVRQELGDTVDAFAADSSDVEQQKELARKAAAALNSIDILVINAGIADLKPVEQWTEAAYDRTFNVNVRGPFFLIQALLPFFAPEASIVLNASINAHVGMPNTSVYGASKA